MLFLSMPLFAARRPVVLVSYYDAFQKSEFNNSEKVALGLAASLSREPTFEIKLCALPTSFERGYAALEECYKALESAPIMYLGLGEYGCAMKIETMVRNVDKNTKIPDNDGTLRNGEIIPGSPKVLGLNLPAPEMYCALGEKVRGDVEVSNNAGSFVCNSTAYKFSHYYQEIPSGFIHVPSNHCKGLEEKTRTAVTNLKLMLRTAIRTLETRDAEVPRQPLTKSELAPLRNDKSNKCHSEFYKRSKTADQMGLWSLLN